jgi:ferrous iron transport protein A
MLPLSVCKSGDSGLICKITGKDDVRRHLAELGFVLGENVRVLTEIEGNMIVQVKESRVALSRDLASRIMI